MERIVMRTATRKMEFARMPRTYTELVRMHVPRPLHDHADLRNATEIIDAMAGHKLNEDQSDYLDLLSTLVADYEDQHERVAQRKLSPLEALRYLLEENGMNASDLGRLLGNRELGSKILRGQRKLSMSHVRKLAARFAVEPGLFIAKE
jgi:HTH-type transcriptional regulator/antitoxin HigA